MRRTRTFNRAGFTLIELMVVIAIIALLIAILLPSLNEARLQGQRTKDLANLHAHGRLAATAAAEDSQNRLHIPHYFTFDNIDIDPLGYGSPVSAFMGAGDHDWGGANAISNLPNDRQFGPFRGVDRGQATPIPGNFTNPGGSARTLGAYGRYQNDVYFTEYDYNSTWAVQNREEAAKDFELWHSPRDTGMFGDRPGDSPSGVAVAGAPGYGPNQSEETQSVFRATGNSYMGDFLFMKDHGLDTANPPQPIYQRWGGYNRPQDLFAEAPKNVLFWESRWGQAMANHPAMRAAPSLRRLNFGEEEERLPGWYGMGKFNAVFADGHAKPVPIRGDVEGDVYRPSDFRQALYQDGPDHDDNYWQLYWRGPSWRYDNFPFRANARSWTSPWPPRHEDSRRIDNIF